MPPAALLALLLAVSSSPSPTVATVDGRRITAAQAFQTVLGDGQRPPEPRALDDAGRARACKVILVSVRLALEENALRAAGVWKPGASAVKRMEAQIPSRQDLEKMTRAQNDRTELLKKALDESAKTPARDREIWNELLSSFMTYDGWVAFRAQVRDREKREGHPAQFAKAPEKLSDASVARMRQAYRDSFLESEFQRWLLKTRGGAGGAWTDALQDAYWSAALPKARVAIEPAWGCPAPTPATLRAPRVPPMERAAAAAEGARR